MSRFLTLIPFLDAKRILGESARLKYNIRTIPVTRSVGFCAAEPVFSRLTLPVSDVSQMDGFSVKSHDTLSATDKNQVIISDFQPVHTGSHVSACYDAVIPHEEIRIIDEGQIGIIKPVRPGQNIQRCGSEIKTEMLIIPKGHCITPSDTGALLSYGIMNVSVCNVVAGVIPTGDELIEPFVAPEPGEIIESNSSVISCYLETLGIESIIYPITPDRPDDIKNILRQAVSECNLVIISGGTSTGKRDYSHSVIQDLGGVLFHGIAMRPGKTILAGLIDDIPVFALPGNPHGSLTALRELITPWLSDQLHPVPEKKEISVFFPESVPSEPGVDDFIQVMAGRIGDKYVGIPAGRGSGQLSTIHANGILHIKRELEGCRAGSYNKITLFRSNPSPDNILLFIGVYDQIIDYLDMVLRRSGSSIMYRRGNQDNVLLSALKGGLLGGIIKRRFISGEYRLISDIQISLDDLTILNIAEYENNIELGDNNANCARNGSECTTGNISPGTDRSRSDVFIDATGRESIDFIIRDEDLNRPEISLIRNVLSSEEWRENLLLLPGYSLEGAGEAAKLKIHHNV